MDDIDRPADGVFGPDPGTALGSVDQMRDIESLIDAALSRLAPQELLGALAERVRQALHVDTAAVLLLDPKSAYLVATAASGLEEEVQQGVRIPVGKGFAGRIATEARCVILDDVDHTKVVNPLLLDRGIRSLMGAPLLSGGSVIGVMHVGTLSPRLFTSADVKLLQIAADRAAIAVEALNRQTDREAAAALQRSLLPSALPVTPGLQIAARYAPGSGTIGGDWYDVFTLPSGQVCAVIGDVAGSGLSAAVIMGRLRSALRAYALETADPAEILRRLDRKMAHFEPDAMATVLCAVFSHDLSRLTISNAGHLPPILAVPGEPAAPVSVTPDALIGGVQCGPRQLSTIELPPDGVLCLYTDGLVERRRWPIDDGIARLCKALRTTDADACCAAAMSAMADISPHSDDVAVLIFHRTAEREETAQEVEPRQREAVSSPRVTWSGRHAVVTMPVELDATNAQGFYLELASAASQRPAILTVDITTTAFCDSGGLNTLTRARRLVVASGGEFRVALGDSPVRRIFQLTGMDQVMPVFYDIAESLAAGDETQGAQPRPDEP
jgi:sigma-B regulation protein RsbU (phosphoserine phosphatase)